MVSTRRLVTLAELRRSGRERGRERRGREADARFSYSRVLQWISVSSDIKISNIDADVHICSYREGIFAFVQFSAVYSQFLSSTFVCLPRAF